MRRAAQLLSRGFHRSSTTTDLHAGVQNLARLGVEASQTDVSHRQGCTSANGFRDVEK